MAILGRHFEQQFGVGFVAQHVRLCSAKAAFCVSADVHRDGSPESSMCPFEVYSVVWLHYDASVHGRSCI